MLLYESCEVVVSRSRRLGVQQATGTAVNCSLVVSERVVPVASDLMLLGNILERTQLDVESAHV